MQTRNVSFWLWDLKGFYGKRVKSWRSTAPWPRCSKIFPLGLLLDWVVIEEEAHHTLLINIIHVLKQTAQKGGENGADSVEMERDTMLCWVGRLRMKEQAVVAACLSLKGQACWENGNVVDAFLDALVMDSEKHQRFLLAVEKAIENIIMSRPQ